MILVSWLDRAACRDHHPELWFSLPGSIDHQKALAICQGCPVRADCLMHALDTPETVGVWGGLDETQRHLANQARRDTAA